MPLTVTLPVFTLAPSRWLVITELTTISVIGVLAAFSWLMKRSRSGNLPTGTRYAGFIQNPPCGLVNELIAMTCFIQYVPVQPGTTIRAGKPFQCGSGCPFISYATMVVS